MNSSALRARVESSLRNSFPSPFAYREPIAPETVSTGNPELDRAIGGLPRGGLTEICGLESAGRTSLLLSVLAEATTRGELCALLDGRDTLDPHSAVAAGIDLAGLLWVRCRKLEQALRSVELLLEGGGFGIVALDLAGVSARFRRSIPLAIWFRLRWTIRNARTALIVVEREPTAGTSASLVVRLEAEAIYWSAIPENLRNLALPDPYAMQGSCRPSHARLLSGFTSHTETLRSRHTLGMHASLRTRAMWR
jgi:recombination protein RecA